MPCCLKIIDMAGVKNVETAIGGRQLFAAVSKIISPSYESFQSENLILNIQRTNPAVLGKGLSIGLMVRRLVL